MKEANTEYYDQQWNLQYEKLVEFKRKNGHCIVPLKSMEDKAFGRWVGGQRERHKSNKMPQMRQDRKDLLDALGFVWTADTLAARVSAEDKKWHLQYDKLVELKRKTGHCIVPQVYKEDKSLGTWVHGQRKNHTKNKLRPDRKQLLDTIGFAWNVNGNVNNIAVQDKKWHQQYKKLVEFQEKNDHCIVPTKYEQDKALGQWVHTQRSFHTKEEIRLDRKDLLDAIGFVWKVDTTDLAVWKADTIAAHPGDDKRWHQKYEKLVEFQREKGHCMVPKLYEHDKSLGEWVNKQRSNHRNNKILQNRKDLLNEIGFVWTVERAKNTNDKLWHQQHEKLVEFKRTNGHCMVPRRNKEDKALGQWVHAQRRHHKNNEIRLDRKRILDEIGFVWIVKNRSSTTDDVRGLDIRSFHDLRRSFFSLWFFYA
jgi:hypothetical protein